jgi:hypothetical protein
MNYQTIKKMQKEYDVFGIQAMINSGDCWKLEGSVGRHASNLLDIGVCMLPKIQALSIEKIRKSFAVGCPASKEGGYKSNCATCGLCSGLLGKGKKDVKIIVH